MDHILTKSQIVFLREHTNKLICNIVSHEKENPGFLNFIANKNLYADLKRTVIKKDCQNNIFKSLIIRSILRKFFYKIISFAIVNTMVPEKDINYLLNEHPLRVEFAFYKIILKYVSKMICQAVADFAHQKESKNKKADSITKLLEKISKDEGITLSSFKGDVIDSLLLTNSFFKITKRDCYIKKISEIIKLVKDLVGDDKLAIKFVTLMGRNCYFGIDMMIMFGDFAKQLTRLTIIDVSNDKLFFAYRKFNFQEVVIERCTRLQEIFFDELNFLRILRVANNTRLKKVTFHKSSGYIKRITLYNNPALTKFRCADSNYYPFLNNFVNNKNNKLLHISRPLQMRRAAIDYKKTDKKTGRLRSSFWQSNQPFSV